MSTLTKLSAAKPEDVLDDSPERAQRIQNDHALADAARRFVTLEADMSGDWRPDPGQVIAFMVARHDMSVLVGVPCGCDEGTCPGVSG